LISSLVLINTITRRKTGKRKEGDLEGGTLQYDEERVHEGKEDVNAGAGRSDRGSRTSREGKREERVKKK